MGNKIYRAIGKTQRIVRTLPDTFTGPRLGPASGACSFAHSHYRPGRGRDGLQRMMADFCQCEWRIWNRRPQRKWAAQWATHRLRQCCGWWGAAELRGAGNDPGGIWDGPGTRQPRGGSGRLPAGALPSEPRSSSPLAVAGWALQSVSRRQMRISACFSLCLPRSQATEQHSRLSTRGLAWTRACTACHIPSLPASLRAVN